MPASPFSLVDVFAETQFTGNQLAVIHNGGGMSADFMQQIALEMGFSETTFVLSSAPREGGYDVRIFTPGAEVEFAGHPTLGTAYVLREVILQQPLREITLNLKVGQVPVRFEVEGDSEVLWMRQPAPRFATVVETARAARALALNTRDIGTHFPIQVVSTGLPFLIVPLRTLDAVRRATVQMPRYLELVNLTQIAGILVFCAETYHQENQLNVRVFAPLLGITEDPATGSANGCLAAYLVKYRYFRSESFDSVRVEQGYEIKRPSLLRLRASETAQSIRVEVGGRVQRVATGELH